MDVSGHAIERLCSPPAVARPRPEAGLSHEPAVARARRRASGDGLRDGPRSPSFPRRKRQERRPALPVGGRLGSEPPARSARHSGRRIRAGGLRGRCLRLCLWRARAPGLHGAVRRRTRSPRVAPATHQRRGAIRASPRRRRAAAPPPHLRRTLHRRRRTAYRSPGRNRPLHAHRARGVRRLP